MKVTQPSEKERGGAGEQRSKGGEKSSNVYLKVGPSFMLEKKCAKQHYFFGGRFRVLQINVMDVHSSILKVILKVWEAADPKEESRREVLLLISRRKVFQIRQERDFLGVRVV
eukprot:422642-Pelagomonas_calceolata.AAC.4